MNLKQLWESWCQPSKVLKLEYLLKRDGIVLAMFKLRGEETEQCFFVNKVDVVKRGFRLGGYTAKLLESPSVGSWVLCSDKYIITKVIQIGDVPRENKVTVGGFRAFIKTARSQLGYDEQLVFLHTTAGEPIWITANCNINDSGFSAKKAYPMEHNPDGVCGIFIEWNLVPFYPGIFNLDAKPINVKNFVYYDWMGDQVKYTGYIKQRKEIHRVDMALRLNRFKEKLVAMTQELNELITLSTERRD